ncbi:MAG: LLM class flavin-dependent oxidoreductase, partial [Actinomycetota bacterium]|nr:LLM class flavin-dependent oxidoreductase [Actinomycetota bacterium]
MKVRFGFTCRGTADLPIEQFGHLVAELERLDFDSIWLPETMLTGSFDPIVGLTYAAARTTRLKLGTHLVVPGRSPVRLARELAQLDRLSNGRLLLTAVLGLPDPDEIAAQDVERSERGALLEEVVELLRRLWSGETVTHEGRYRLSNAHIDPLPVQEPIEIWFGGQLPGALRRAGRMSDGYLPGLCTPDEAAGFRVAVDEAAAANGRTIDPEHFGVNLSYHRGPLPEAAVEGLRARRADLDPAAIVPTSPAALNEIVDAWLEAGFSKFLLRPLVAPPDWTA